MHRHIAQHRFVRTIPNGCRYTFVCECECKQASMNLSRELWNMMRWNKLGKKDAHKAENVTSSTFSKTTMKCVTLKISHTHTHKHTSAHERELKEKTNRATQKRALSVCWCTLLCAYDIIFSHFLYFNASFKTKLKWCALKWAPRQRHDDDDGGETKQKRNKKQQRQQLAH